MLNTLWPWKVTLANRSTFQGVMADSGLRWFDYMQHTASAYATELSICFAFVATHNHFVLDRGGKVFNRSSPVVKLPAGTGEEPHLELLGLLNSSVACFWMKQVFHNKGSTVDQHGARQRTDAFEDFYEHTGNGLKDFPVPTERPLSLARHLDALATGLGSSQPGSLLPAANDGALPSRASLDTARERAMSLRRQMIAAQEELDWECYGLYGLPPTAPAGA
ncbi:MAG: hypothetical protein LC121_10400 [Anaerolineae bacterium]|nr:hypothetical protein [Anaerolineae bacterium]